MKSFLKSYIQKLLGLSTSLDEINYFARSSYKSPKMLEGKFLSNYNNNRSGIANIRDLEFQVFSQFGDDGIIQGLINRIPLNNKTFIEFGVENYLEANTRFLLLNNYWSGFVVDGSLENVTRIKNDEISFLFDLEAKHSFITPTNINNIISSSGFLSSEIGILSIDVDGQDYWIWKAIDCINPAIVICEYNSLFGFSNPFTIPYDESFVRGQKYPFSFYGTSLTSICDLAHSRGLKFIGCNSAGNNAYFVRSDLLNFLPFPEISAKEGYVFSSFSESHNKIGQRNRGFRKIAAIDKLVVVNTRTGEHETFSADKVWNELELSGKLMRN